MNHLLVSAKSKLTSYPLVEQEQNIVRLCVEEIQNLLERHPPIFVMGKKCFPARDVTFFSDSSQGYKYSNQRTKPVALPDSLKNLLELVNYKFKANFNGILVNRYQTGNDYIGKHSDDEKELTPQGVVSISWGASRKFRIRDKKTGKIKLDWDTQNQEILVMSGDFQKEFTHEIPKQKKIKEVRYSFTFRCHHS